MPDEETQSVEVLKLPKEFYDALDKVSATVTENAEEIADETGRKENDLSVKDITFFAPDWNEKYKLQYTKIAETFFTAGIDIYFKKLKEFQKREEYAKQKDLTPPKKEKEDKALEFVRQQQAAPADSNAALVALVSAIGLKFIADLLGDGLGGKIMTASLNSLGFAIRAIRDEKLFVNLRKGITYFSRTLGKIFGDLPGQLKNIAKSFNKWAVKRLLKLSPRIGRAIIKVTSSIAKLFSNLRSFLSPISGAIGKVGKLLGTGTGGLMKILGSGALGIFKSIASKLRFIPFVGTAIVLYQAYNQFQEGKWFDGALTLASAILPYAGPVGMALSTGISLVQGLFKYSPSTAKVVGTVAKGLSLVKAIMPVAKLAMKPLATVLKKIPFLGSMISFYSAVKNYQEGNWVKGTLDVVSGIANFFPGIGTAIAIGLDVINMTLDNGGALSAVSAGAKLAVKKGISLLKLLKPLAKVVMKPFGFILRKIPFIGSIISFYSAYSNFKDGKWAKGSLDIVSAIGGLFPGIGTAIVIGVDIVNAFLNEDTDKNGEKSFSIGGFSISKFFGDIHDKFIKPAINWFMNNSSFGRGFRLLGEAWDKIKTGDVLGSLKAFGKGLWNISPIGAFFNGAISLVSGLFETDKATEIPTEKKPSIWESFKKKIGEAAKKMADYAKKGIKSAISWIPGAESLFDSMFGDDKTVTTQSLEVTQKMEDANKKAEAQIKKAEKPKEFTVNINDLESTNLTAKELSKLNTIMERQLEETKRARQEASERGAQPYSKEINITQTNVSQDSGYSIPAQTITATDIRHSYA